MADLSGIYALAYVMFLLVLGLLFFFDWYPYYRNRRQILGVDVMKNVACDFSTRRVPDGKKQGDEAKDEIEIEGDAVMAAVDIFAGMAIDKAVEQIVVKIDEEDKKQEAAGVKEPAVEEKKDVKPVCDIESGGKAVVESKEEAKKDDKAQPNSPLSRFSFKKMMTEEEKTKYKAMGMKTVMTELITRDEKMEKYLEATHYYFGIGDVLYPGGAMTFWGRKISAEPGMIEDFIYYIYNYDPLVSCFAADDNNPVSRLTRKLLWLVDHAVAFFFYCLVELGDLGAVQFLVQILIGLLTSVITKVTFYCLMCPCFIGTKNEHIQTNCQKSMKLVFVALLALTMGLIAGSIAMLATAQAPDAALITVLLFYVLVFLPDTIRRIVFLVIKFNSTGSFKLKLWGIIFYNSGQWFQEKYNTGCLSLDQAVVTTKKYWFVEVETIISAKASERYKEARAKVEEAAKKKMDAAKVKMEEAKVKAAAAKDAARLKMEEAKKKMGDMDTGKVGEAARAKMEETKKKMSEMDTSKMTEAARNKMGSAMDSMSGAAGWMKSRVRSMSGEQEVKTPLPTNNDNDDAVTKNNAVSPSKPVAVAVDVKVDEVKIVETSSAGAAVVKHDVVVDDSGSGSNEAGKDTSVDVGCMPWSGGARKDDDEVDVMKDDSDDDAAGKASHHVETSGAGNDNENPAKTDTSVDVGCMPWSGGARKDDDDDSTHFDMDATHNEVEVTDNEVEPVQPDHVADDEDAAGLDQNNEVAANNHTSADDSKPKSGDDDEN